MSKYKLSVKYSGVCELSFESDKRDTVEKEFDRYLASFLSGKIIKNALKIDFSQAFETQKEQKQEEPKDTPNNEEAINKEPETKETPVQKETQPPKEEKQEEKPASAQEEPHKELSFDEYVKNKNIYSPLDEFVAGACYLDEIQNVKDFTLKQINSKLYPVFRRLADLGIIEHAKKRVLIETKEIDGQTHYSINENAWNYHNYDLVRHQ